MADFLSGLDFVNGLMVVALNGGPIMLWLLLLNARDRRRDRAAIAVRRVCEAPSLRGWVGLNVRASLLSRRTAVALDMSECGADVVWSTIYRLADVLPHDVTLAIETRLDGALPVTITLRRPAGLVPRRPTGIDSCLKNNQKGARERHDAELGTFLGCPLS